MAFKQKIKRAWTLAEIMIVFIIIGMVTAATITTTRAKANYYLNKFMYYSAYSNLQAGMEETIKDLGSIPASGNGLCTYLANLYNTVGAVDCTRSGTASFTNADMNFRATNGLRFFNLGVAGPTGVNLNTGSAPTVTTVNAYTVYIDIDGDKRNSTLNNDVFRFYVRADNGRVLPFPNEAGAINMNFLSVAVRYPTATGPVWVTRDQNFKGAFCRYLGYYMGSGAGSVCTAAEITDYNAGCSPASGHVCELVTNKPRYSLFAL